MKKKSKYYVRPDGLHEALKTVILPDGTKKRVAFRGASDSEVDRKILEFKGIQERGPLFEEVAEPWKEKHFKELAVNTLRSYRPAYKRALDEFTGTPIRQIKPPDIKRFITEFSKGGKAKKTVSTQLLILSLIFGYAAESGYIEYSPTIHVSVPKNLPKTKRDAATPEDEEKVKKSADVWLLPYLILYTGLRKGEALALMYDDILHDVDKIVVSKSVYHENNKPKIKKPKTVAGIRRVPILFPLKDKLPKKTGKKYIFSMDGGKTPLSETQYQKCWYDYCKATGVTSSVHRLRHSYATMLFEYGVEEKDAQDWLGHATAAMTKDIYTHIRESRRESTAKKLNDKLIAEQKPTDNPMAETA